MTILDAKRHPTQTKMIKKLLKDGWTEILYLLKRVYVILLSLWCFYLLYVWYSKGFLWFLLLFIITGGALFVLFRSHLMLAIRTIEMQLWGKPLDKLYWKKEKPPKLKFVWKRDRSKDEKTN